MSEVILIAHDLRSCYNVGSLMRTADGLGVSKLIFTGTTPYPRIDNDARLPHVARRAHSQIAKTALGAEETVPFTYFEKLEDAITHTRQDGFKISALEQNEDSTDLHSFKPSPKQAIIAGNEVTGLPDDLEVDSYVEIPMLGSKNSFNVSVASALALYEIQRKQQH